MPPSVRTTTVWGVVLALVGLVPVGAVGAEGIDGSRNPERSFHIASDAGSSSGRWMVRRTTGWSVVDPDGRDRAALLDSLAADPGVLEVRREAVFVSGSLPDDPCRIEGSPACVIDTGTAAHQWYLAAVGATAAWNVTTGDPGVVVAVLDSGIRATHVELDDGRVIDWRDCGIAPNDLTHGTRVAGIIGAATDDGFGVAGLGWRTRPADIPVLERVGQSLQGREGDVIAALDCAVSRGADVVNMSFSGPATPALDDALSAAAAAGVVLVAAAGNDPRSGVLYPAGHPQVIGVAASTRAGNLSSFSSRGSWVTLAAPGEDLLTTDGAGDTSYASAADGTSFSAPLVSATAALLLAAHPDWDGPVVGARLRRVAASDPPVDVVAGHLRSGDALAASFDGVWMATSDGHIGLAGDASDRGRFDPIDDIVGVRSTPTGLGYHTVASDGGVFAFGDAGFFGSTGSLVLNRPIVGMASTPSGSGYWLVASDGGVFAFGDAAFHGSLPGRGVTATAVGAVPSTTGLGYRVVTEDGIIHAFGDAGELRVNSPPAGGPVVAVAGS